MIDAIKQAVLEGDRKRAAELTSAALESGMQPKAILDQALTAAMDIVGEEYERGDRYVPEMLISATAMKEALATLKPLLADAGVEPRGRVIIGTVEGDLHDIGKDLVAMMLEGGGFEVTNLGVEVSADAFVEAAREVKPDLVAMSALLTTTMTTMPVVIKALQDAGLREAVKVIIGGAPVTEAFAKEIGADGYAADAASAVSLAARLVPARVPEA